MKKTIATFIFTYSFVLNSQNINVTESKENFSTGSQNAIVTTIYENGLDEVLSAWKKVLKDYKNETIKDSKGELFADNLLVKEWGNNTIDVYTTFVANKKDKTVKMATAFDLGGTYLSSNGDKDKYNYFEKIIKDFAINQTKTPLINLVKTNEKKLNSLESDQKSIEKKTESLKNDITDYKAKISKNETLITAKDGEISKKKSEVEVQKKVVEASSDAVAEQAKASKKIYEKLTGQLTDLEKEKRSLKKDIDNYNDKIKDSEKAIKKNDEKLAEKIKEVNKQKDSTEAIKKRLESIN
ncbi:MAG: hypothetical protein LCH32_12540 [Bacteroidetes bacterium]|nr:hypothetical protein [Bacteroidota bacterium]